MTYLRPQWAWKPSNSETYFIEKSPAIASAEAERRNMEAHAAALAEQERKQNKENADAKKANREPAVIPMVQPVTYTVLHRQVSAWGYDA